MTTAVLDYAPPAAAAEPRTVADEELRRQLERTWRRPPGLWGFLTSTNHKDIGLRFIITAFVFFLLAGLLAFVMRVQLGGPNLKLLGPDLYNQFFTTHGTTM